MNDLQIAATAPAPAAGARPGASAALRALAPRDGAPQPGSNPFQDALALELELDGAALPPLGLPLGLSGADASLDPADAPAPAIDAAAATDLAAALPGAAIVLPGLAPTAGQAAGLQTETRQDLLAKATAHGRAKAQPHAAAAAANPVDPGQSAPGTAAAPGQAPAAAALQTPPPGAAFAAESAAPGKPAPAAGEAAPQSARQQPNARPSAAAAAAELAAAGRFSAPAEGEIRREAGFAAKLLEQHKAGPTPSTPTAALHRSDGAAPAPAAPAPVPVLETRVGERGWDQGLGDRLVWMAGQKQQVAELHLNPPELGPLKIKLTLNSDQASAQFVSAHAPVREAIETAMPRLREMLADSGITLGDTNVSSEAFREQAQQEQRGYAAASAAAPADSGPVAHEERLLRRAHGLVDTFA